jgi:polynucleotide 5'-hydroxyl-kinase GRC3/NOL9
VLLGASDAGKSSLCHLLLEHLARTGQGVAVLDADPAQKLVGPPACVTLGRRARSGALSLQSLAFVGTLNPLQGWRRLVAGTGRLAVEAGANLLLVNTSGLLAGAGRRLKAAKIAAVRPDLLVALGTDPPLLDVLADHRAIPTLRLTRALAARRKTEGERRALRRSAFRAYFEGVPVWPLALDGLCVEGEAPLGPRRLVALADAAGNDLALGIVLGGEAAGSVLVRAPRPERPVAALRSAALRLDEDCNTLPARR